MVRIKREINAEWFKYAKETSPYRLIPADVKMGYGVYTALVEETEDGKFFLIYDRGESCD